MSDTQFDTYEVFHQKKKGDPHIHVGAVHAPDPETALQYARDQFARRLQCVSLWVVNSKHVTETNYQDDRFFNITLDKSYRDPKDFGAPLKESPDE